MSDLPKDFSGVIGALAGAQLCQLLGVSSKHLSQMRWRNSIPSRYWHLIAAEAESRGLEGMDLASLQRMKVALAMTWEAERDRRKSGSDEASLS
jgi:hypothetical protein